MGEAITRGAGTVVNYAGDAMLVVFNGPIAVPDPERRAARTALEMRDGFLAHAANWSKQGYRLGLRIGIAAGFASLGMIGYPGRYELGVLGRTINMAGRLCVEAPIGSILTSERVAHELEEIFDLRPVGDVMLRGFSRPVSVVEVVGHRDSPLAAPSWPSSRTPTTSVSSARSSPGSRARVVRRTSSSPPTARRA